MNGFYKPALGMLIAAILLLNTKMALGTDWLITPEETAASELRYKTTPLFSAKSLPVQGAPEIKLVAPADAAAIKPPVDIQLAFYAKDNSGIEVSSFRVLYGSFGIDITKRILKYGVPTENGIRVNHAELPQGHHVLFVQITDKLHRTGETEFNLDVE